MPAIVNRRDFLKAAPAAGTVLAAAATASAARAGMYVSLNGSLTGGKVPWPEFARLAARAGYGGVDVDLGAAMKSGASPTKALLAELKLKPAMMSLPVNFSRDDEAFQNGMKRLPEAAKFAADIGCPRMIGIMPPSSQTPKAEFRKLLKDRITAIAQELNKNKVRVGFEFLGPLHFRSRAAHVFIYRLDEMVEFASECGPNVGVLLDAWHWYHAGNNVNDIITAGKSRIVHVHVSDCIKQTPEEVRDNQRVLPGEGVIPLVPFFQALKKVGYVDGVSPEPIGRIPKDMPPEEGARLGLQTALDVMKKAGAV